jgi:Glyoxalase/Bleomycin resistance protein/Dioxygenase superfamily
MSTPYFHVGIQVRNIEEAISDFGHAFDVVFNRPTKMNVPMIRSGVRERQSLIVTYSQDGPPYLELIEATGSGFFRVDSDEGVHHIGMWLPEDGQLTDQDRFSLLHIDAEMPHEDTTGTVTRMTRPECLHGVRLELMEPADRVRLQAWISGKAEAPR